jgi:hypothetical protein
MRHRLKITLWLLGALFFLSGGVAAAANVPVLGSAGPLRWQATGVGSVLTADRAIQAAGKLLEPERGVLDKSSTAQLVQVTDSTPATAGHGGVNTVYTAWLISAPGFSLHNTNTGQDATVTLSALVSDRDAGTPQLYAVFTARNDGAWVEPYPGFKPRAPAADMEEDQWDVKAEPATTAPTRDITKLLSTFWSTTGVNPASAGQIALVARNAAPRLPARRIQGKLTPLYPPGRYWVMLVSGTKTHRIILPAAANASSAPTSTSPYMSGMASLIQPQSGTVLRSVYLP